MPFGGGGGVSVRYKLERAYVVKASTVISSGRHAFQLRFRTR